jgi:hypothetical protein
MLTPWMSQVRAQHGPSLSSDDNQPVPGPPAWVHQAITGSATRFFVGADKKRVSRR